MKSHLLSIRSFHKPAVNYSVYKFNINLSSYVVNIITFAVIGAVRLCYIQLEKGLPPIVKGLSPTTLIYKLAYIPSPMGVNGRLHQKQYLVFQ